MTMKLSADSTLEGEPVRVRAQMQCLAGPIRDADGHRHGFAWQELFLTQDDFHADLRRRADQRQQHPTYRTNGKNFI